MKIKFYGTAAAEGVPALFCGCDVCQRSRANGGRNVRTRSQALVNERLLIDFPPDTMAHALFYGLPMKDIENVIITHSHGDHLMPYDFEQKRVGYAHMDHMKPLNIYGCRVTLEVIQNTLVSCGCAKEDRWNLHEFRSFEPLLIDGLEVCPLAADHNPKTEPHIFNISDGRKRLLYGNDTGYFPDETWDFIESTKQYYSFVSLDCTAIFLDWRKHHMGIKACTEVKERMTACGAADQNTVFVLHHFSHNGKATYDDLVPIAKEHGFDVSYDTMEVQF